MKLEAQKSESACKAKAAKRNQFILVIIKAITGNNNNRNDKIMMITIIKQ